MMTAYTPPKVWKMSEESLRGTFASVNQPTAGARFDKKLPVGIHPLQLYSMGTPNGIKITIMLEELLELGVHEAEYDAHLIKILEQDQFSSGFVEINPNSKIPALVDHSQNDSLSVFESGAILLYLAEKFHKFLPKDLISRTKVLNWLFWLQGSAPFLGGGFGHFYSYAPEKIEYPINRFSLEAKRQFDVLDKQLMVSEYIAGSDYSIADMAIFPWYGALALGKLYNTAAEFLSTHEYKNLLRWAKNIDCRSAVKKGSIVNVFWLEDEKQLKERHSAKDFDAIYL